mgnify:CR=1 FL=1
MALAVQADGQEILTKFLGDICGCEHHAATTTDSGSLHLCNDCTWTELYVVRRPLDPQVSDHTRPQERTPLHAGAERGDARDRRV